MWCWLPSLKSEQRERVSQVVLFVNLTNKVVDQDIGSLRKVGFTRQGAFHCSG
jgi:hypothetical protein